MALSDDKIDYCKQRIAEIRSEAASVLEALSKPDIDIRNVLDLSSAVNDSAVRMHTMLSAVFISDSFEAIRSDAKSITFQKSSLKEFEDDRG